MIGKCPIQKISEKGLTNNLNTIKSASPKSKSTPIQSQFARRRRTNQRSATKRKKRKKREKEKKKEKKIQKTPHKNEEFQLQSTKRCIQ